MQTLRARPVMVIVIVLLALSLLTGVVYAIGRLTGYIPGVGFVQTNSLRVLAEPVSQTREGITVSIEQVVVDSERTIIIYKTEGLTIAAANSKGEGGPFGAPTSLRLPDGTNLETSPDNGYGGTPEPLINNIHTEGGWPNYVWRLVYPPVPAGMNELTLSIPILQTMPAGAAPENWEITFHLKPAPPDMAFALITELAPSTPPQAEPSSSGVTGTPALSNTASLNGFTFKLENVIELDDGFVFTGNLSWDKSAFPTGRGSLAEPAIPTLTDESGQIIPIEEVQLNAVFDEHHAPWSYRTNRKAFTGPLVLSIQSIKTGMIAPAIDFIMDFGPNPQIGQTRDVNRDFTVEGHTVRLLSVSLGTITDSCQGVGVNFNFRGDTPGVYAFMDDVVTPTPIICVPGSGGGGGGGPVDPTLFSAVVTYRDNPTGVHHYLINVSVPYVVNGLWQVAWTPPLVEAPSTPTSEPGACLTLNKWNQLSARNDALPSGLGGKILTTINEGGLWPAIYVSNFDGTNSRKIDAGTWPSLSTDGTRLAYSIGDGIHVFNLSTGENPAIGTDGYRIIWSPDSTRMMYTTTFSLNVVNADGSGLQKIDTGSAQVISSVGWLPDNQTIVYGAMGGDGVTFATYNLQSGETKELFIFQNKAGFGAISPNGQWIVFADRIFGATNWGIFISRLDGSERKLVAEPEVPTAFTSVWSPDGQWLVITTPNKDGLWTIPVLVNPFTCQVVRLNNINGMIEGWSP
ncbi:MAG: eIF2A-related protein [Anaerolineales bacterium]